MKTKRFIVALLMAVVATGPAFAQLNHQATKTGHKKFDEDVQGMYDRYNKFRKKIIQDYCEFIGDKDRWKQMMGEAPVPVPQEEEIVPQLAPGADQETASWFGSQMDKLHRYLTTNNKPIPKSMQRGQQRPQPRKAAQGKPQPRQTAQNRSRTQQRPRPQSQPKQQNQPKQNQSSTQKPPLVGPEEAPYDDEIPPLTSDVLPVKTVIQPEPELPPVEPEVEPMNFTTTFDNGEYTAYTVFGTQCKVRIGKDCKFTLRDLQPRTLANAIENFSDSQYENLLYDCLQERKRLDFSDWAYYQMLQTVCRQFYGEASNEAVLAMAFLYSQSGYKMRLAHDGTHLFMLVATHHFIYNKPFFNMDGEYFFMLDGREAGSLRICDAKFPKESSLSLQMTANQQLAQNPTSKRTITSKMNSNFSFTITSNQNYLDFYGTYPSSYLNNNFMTRWAMYANTPLEKGVRDQLYPALKQKLAGLSKKDAVQQLLWWVQTGFDYAYDEEIWGEDRAFFGEESLFYPFCDCEDRSILLSHLVRDLVGLDVCLVYYPGHLAMAVCFNEDVAGDYYLYEGRKFVVCDPTYIRARIGDTMPMVKGLETNLILLQKS